LGLGIWNEEFYVPNKEYELSFRCVTHLHVLIIIEQSKEQKAQECDATKML